MIDLLRNAKKSILVVSSLESSFKDKIIVEMADSILRNSDYLLSENSKDVQIAKNSDMNSIFLERLFLTKDKIKAISQTLLTIASLDDPTDRVLDEWINKDGLKIKKISVPIGLIAVIYESRPNVTSDTAALCFKSGNVCVLKGGKEANYSNRAIAKILQDVLVKNDLPREIITFLEHWNRDDLLPLIQQNQYIDLIIPRGGSQLNRFVSKNATTAVIQQDRGLCHVYIHSEANLSKALEIALNSKCEYPAVCNAAETLLVDISIAEEILPKLYALFTSANTHLKGCYRTQNIIKVEEANDKDFDTEYLDNILNIKIVNSIDEAILHIDNYGSKHSESIVTEDNKSAQYFMKRVDAACVYHNASTKFTDGNTFGLGAEVGISTSKLHARGPIGLKELCVYKYQIYGKGQIKVSWLYRFGYSGILSMLIIGAVLSFYPLSMIMLPLGYLSFKYQVSLLISIFFGTVVLFLLTPKVEKFVFIKYLFNKYSGFSKFVNKNIRGLEWFSSLPSALLKMPKKGVTIFRLLNISFWVSFFTVLGYAIAKI